MRPPFSVPARLAEASRARLIRDRKSGFGFLSSVPSTRSQLFADYWKEFADEQEFMAYANQLYKPTAFADHTGNMVPEGFEDYCEQRSSSWKYASFGVKKTLGLLAKRRAVPKHILGQGIGLDEMLAHADRSWLTRRDIIASLKKEFSIRTIGTDNGSFEYGVSRCAALASVDTRVTIDVKLSMISYYHTVDGGRTPFVLVDHSGASVVSNWNRLSHENLEPSVRLLAKIVDDFEADLPNLAERI